LTKGSQISLSGRIEIQKWTDKENEIKYKTNIVAEEVSFLSSNQKNSEDTKPKSAKPQNTKSSDVDDLPF
jgi:single-stranded DNA-binding protein